MINPSETTVFVSGSISIKELKPKVKETLDRIMQQNFEIIVGDAYGVDEQVIKYCEKKQYYNLCIYYIYDEEKQNSTGENLTRQKNLNKNFKTKRVDIPSNLKNKKVKKREKQIIKDKKMAEDCTYAFAIWNEESIGTYNNCKECYEKYKKIIKVYLNRQDKFIKITNQNDINKIDEIYEKNNGFTKEKVCEILNIKNDELNDILTKYGIHKKNGNKYIPTNKYEKLFIEKKNIGKYSSYKFTNELISIIEKIIQNNSSNDLFSELKVLKHA